MKNPISKTIDFNDINLSILGKLKPAATKLIIDADSVEIIELIKLTLFDLILKKVLIFKKEFRRLNPNDKYEREYLIIETGKNFKKYKPDAFELYFIDKIDENSYFHLKSYIKEIVNEIDSNFSFKKKIIKGSKITSLFKDEALLNIFKILKISKKGQKIKTNIHTFLKEVDKNIGYLINHEPDNALDIVLFLKGNIFLLENIEFELWEKIKTVYKTKMETDDDFYDEWFLLDMSFDNDFSISNLFSEDSEFFDDLTDSFNYGDDADWDSSDFDFD